jgi:hypothetical protein
MKSLLSIALLLLVGCATSLKAPSGFVQAGQTPVRCSADMADVCERAYSHAADIVRRVEGKEYSSGKIVVRWSDSETLHGSETTVGYAQEKRGGWDVELGQGARDNLVGYLTHEFVHCISGALGHDVRYDASVFAWRYSRERSGK